jgi:dienelactone hydrolase
VEEFMSQEKFLSRYVILVALLLTRGYGIPATPDFITSGEQANALICRPDGKGPFAAVIWSHGRVEKDKRGGWQRLCDALASEGILAFIPIREIERGLRPSDLSYNKAALSGAVDYVKSLPDVDPSRVALMGHSRGGLLTLMLGLERTDLRALIITAPADIRPYFQQSVARGIRLRGQVYHHSKSQSDLIFD